MIILRNILILTFKRTNSPQAYAVPRLAGALKRLLSEGGGIWAGGDGHLLDRRRERDVRVRRRQNGDGTLCRHRGAGAAVYSDRLRRVV